MRVPTLSTERLLLRQWRPGDREPFATMNAHARVMEHFPAQLTRAESDALADRIEERLGADGFGLWATEGARAALDHDFRVVGLDETVSSAAPVTARSVRVMERLGAERWAVLEAARRSSTLDRADVSPGGPWSPR